MNKLTKEQFDQATIQAKEAYGCTHILCVPIWIENDDVDFTLCAKGLPKEGITYIISRLVEMTAQPTSDVQQYVPLSPNFHRNQLPEA